jgi:hypothetical protein
VFLLLPFLQAYVQPPEFFWKALLAASEKDLDKQRDSLTMLHSKVAKLDLDYRTRLFPGFDVICAGPVPYCTCVAASISTTELPVLPLLQVQAAVIS